MKLTKGKKVTLTTTLTMLMSTAVVNAVATSSEAVSRGLGDWVTIVAEILSILCLVVFAIYMGRFLTLKTKKEEVDEKVVNGVRNGVMTSLLGVALCQAAIVVAKLCF